MYESIQIGTLLGGRYEIIEKIGTGGMAEVYKAKCRLLNRLVAIKALKGEFSGDEEFIKRFEVEAQAAASISHPNIVSVYDVGFDKGRHYIVMELAEGITLKEYISKHGALGWREALGIAAQICSALECAHKKNIIHRDIKPHNIIITKNNIAKVTDFGIARAAGGSTMVADSSVMGSAHYLSPEQARGGFTDVKTDIYSTGVTLYEMLTGRVPYDSDSPVSVAMMHVEGGATPPRIINLDIPEAAEIITLKAMCKEKSGRYESAQKMLEDIDNALADRGVVPADNDMVLAEHGERRRRRGAEDAFEKKNKDKKAPLTKSEKRMVVLAIVAAIAFIGVLLGGVGWFVFNGGQWDETVVPELEGRTLEEAQKLLDEAKLNEAITEIASSQHMENTVITQEPAAGRTVKKGSIVRIEVNTQKGIELGIVVPNVVSYDKDAAKIALESVGLVAVFVDEINEAAVEGTVIRQVPSAKAEVKKGDTVRLYISAKNTEATPVDVPTVIGRSLAQAKNAIEAAGLTVGNVVEIESEEAMGTVIKQSPVGGSIANKGSAVALTVSKGGVTRVTPTPTPTQPTATPTSEPVEYKTISMPVPQNKDVTRIKVVANGQTIHDEPHSKDEVAFDLRVAGKSSAKLEIYHDGALVGSQTITFN